MNQICKGSDFYTIIDWHIIYMGLVDLTATDDYFFRRFLFVSFIMYAMALIWFWELRQYLHLSGKENRSIQGNFHAAHTKSKLAFASLVLQLVKTTMLVESSRFVSYPSMHSSHIAEMVKGVTENFKLYLYALR